jgi:hypothetical protein
VDFGDVNDLLSPGMSGYIKRESLVWPVSTAGLDWLPLPTLVLAADGSAIAANGAWAVMSAISPGDSRGNGWRQAIDPIDREALVARLRSAAAAGEPGSAGWRLAGGQGPRWSRWWWRPGPARGLVVCVTEIHADRGGEPIDVDGRSHPVVAATGAAVASGPHEAAGALLARANAMLDAIAPPAARLHVAVTAPMVTGTAAASSEIDVRIELTSAVIQRISWVALILTSAVSLTEGQAAERVHSAVDELDALIRDIRASVFPLLIPPPAAAGA